MVYFTGDLHFGHKNIIGHCGRPYAGLDEMTASLIDKLEPQGKAVRYRLYHR